MLLSPKELSRMTYFEVDYNGVTNTDILRIYYNKKTWFGGMKETYRKVTMRRTTTAHETKRGWITYRMRKEFKSLINQCYDHMQKMNDGHTYVKKDG